MPKKDDPSPWKIGENIQQLRIHMGISQAELAGMSGVSLSTLVKIEGGANDNPRVLTLLAIAHELDAGVDTLLGYPRTSLP